jgi:hypothetical protein
LHRFCKNVFKKLIGLSLLQVVKVVFLHISLPLKTDTPVPRIKIPVPGTLKHPFQKIKKVKEHQEQFRLLPEVDAFVVDQGVILPEGSIPEDDEGPKAKPHIIPVKKMSDNNDHTCEKRLPTNILFNLLIFRPLVRSRRPMVSNTGLYFTTISTSLPYF